ncbi:hypothetical protein BDN71DRAFT_1447955, partial [Pleurotus eryngii]
NPMWNTGVWMDEQSIEEEGATTGRLGRFNRRFVGMGGSGKEVNWMEDLCMRSGGTKCGYETSSPILSFGDASRRGALPDRPDDVAHDPAPRGSSHHIGHMVLPSSVDRTKLR